MADYGNLLGLINKAQQVLPGAGTIVHYNNANSYKKISVGWFMETKQEKHFSGY